MTAKEPISPNSEQQRVSLRNLGRARSYMLVCFYTLPLYIAALLMLLNNGREITLLMFVYMGVYAVFAINMTLRRCPCCNEPFFVRHIFLNMVTKKCTHCGLPLSERNKEKF